jgi:hypothetical protein
MSLRFFRRVRLFPGLRMNLSRSGVSLSVGRRGMWYTVGPRGQQRATLGLPGTALFLTERYPNQAVTKGPGGPPVAHGAPSVRFGRALVIAGEIVAAYSLMIAVLYLAKHG